MDGKFSKLCSVHILRNYFRSFSNIFIQLVRGRLIAIVYIRYKVSLWEKVHGSWIEATCRLVFVTFILTFQEIVARKIGKYILHVWEVATSYWNCVSLEINEILQCWYKKCWELLHRYLWKSTGSYFFIFHAA